MVEVSVVMPGRDAEATIAAAIASVRAQTLTDWELLVVDDASTDSTRQIAHAVARLDPRVRVLVLDRWSGPAVARNHALDHAAGRFVAFLDADDVWLPAKLERHLELHRNTGAMLTYGPYYVVSSGWAGCGRTPPGGAQVVVPPPSRTYAELTWRNVIGCLTAVYERAQAPDARMPNVPGAEDFGLWLELLQHGGQALSVTQPLAVYREGRAGSMTSKPWRMVRALWTLLRSHCGPAAAAARLIRHIMGVLRLWRRSIRCGG